MSDTTAAAEPASPAAPTKVLFADMTPEQKKAKLEERRIRAHHAPKLAGKGQMATARKASAAVKPRQRRLRGRINRK